jgi:hypothetical protein
MSISRRTVAVQAVATSRPNVPDAAADQRLHHRYPLTTHSNHPARCRTSAHKDAGFTQAADCSRQKANPDDRRPLSNATPILFVMIHTTAQLRITRSGRRRRSAKRRNRQRGIARRKKAQITGRAVRPSGDNIDFMRRNSFDLLRVRQILLVGFDR